MTAPISHTLRFAAAGSLLLGTALGTQPTVAETRHGIPNGIAGGIDVGINAAVNPDATGRPPGSAARRLVLGQQVVHDERIATDRAGQTQIVLVDELTMSVGPNSDLVVDNFVYDPRTGAGRLAASATHGVFRYVGGHISKLENGVSVRTPVGIVAIRGGIVLLDLQPGGRLDAIFVYGDALTVTGLNGVVQQATRPGYAITVAGPGASPSAPYLAPIAMTGSLLAQLDGRPGMTGGARTIPTDTMAARGQGLAAGPPPPIVAPPPGGFGGLPPVFVGGQTQPQRSGRSGTSPNGG